METSELFKKEIDYIVNQDLKRIVVSTLNAAPQCIQYIPASSSGKYHPSYSLGEGGLARHVKAAVGIAHSMIQTDIFKNMVLGVDSDDKEELALYKDVAYAAIILHDCKKPDNSPAHNTCYDHPIRAAKLFKNIVKNFITEDNTEYLQKAVPLIYNAIASHMGQFNTSKYSPVVLPKPQSGIDQFVHMCDYLASRKFLIFDFNIYNSTEE